MITQSLRSYEKVDDVKKRRENFIQFLQSMFDEYGLEKISKSNVTMFVEKGNIFSSCGMLYNKYIKEEIAIGARVIVGPNCQYYLRSIIGPNQPNCPFQNVGLPESTWISSGRESGRDETFWKHSTPLTKSLTKLLTNKFVKKGRMTQKGIDETIVDIGDHDVELVIRGLVQFPETPAEHLCTVSIILAPEMKHAHSFCEPAITTGELLLPLDEIGSGIMYTGLAKCTSDKIREKAMDGLIFSGLLYGLRTKNIRIIWSLGIKLAKDAFSRNKCEPSNAHLLEFLSLIQCELTSEGTRSHAYVELRHSLGEIFEARGDYSRAVSCYKNVIEAITRDPVLEKCQNTPGASAQNCASTYWYHLGLAHKRNAELNEAEICYQKSLSIASGHRPGESLIRSDSRRVRLKLAYLICDQMRVAQKNYQYKTSTTTVNCSNHNELSAMQRKWIGTFTPLFSEVLKPYATWNKKRNHHVEKSRFIISQGCGGIAEATKWGLFYDDPTDRTVMMLVVKKKKTFKTIKGWYIHQDTTECIEMPTIADSKKVVHTPTFSGDWLKKFHENYSASSSTNMKHQLRKESKNEDTCTICAMCGKMVKSSVNKCSRCKKVHYCNRDCQKSHWKVHKKECGK